MLSSPSHEQNASPGCTGAAPAVDTWESERELMVRAPLANAHRGEGSDGVYVSMQRADASAKSVSKRVISPASWQHASLLGDCVPRVRALCSLRPRQPPYPYPKKRRHETGDWQKITQEKTSKCPSVLLPDPSRRERFRGEVLQGVGCLLDFLSWPLAQWAGSMLAAFDSPPSSVVAPAEREVGGKARRRAIRASNLGDSLELLR